MTLLPASRDYGLGVIPWSPLAGGLLGGILQKIKEGRRADEDRQKDVKKYRAQIEAWEKFCKQKEEQPADVALAWLLLNPVVTAPIIGPRTLEQLTGALRALKIGARIRDLAGSNSAPPVLMLNMADEAKRNGITIDRESMSRQLGMPVALLSAKYGEGFQ